MTLSHEISSALADIPCEFSKWWRPSDLEDKNRAIHQELKKSGYLSEIIRRKKEFTVFKTLAEEVAPLAAFGVWLAGENAQRLIEVKPLFKEHGRPDALLRLDGQEHPLEITLGVSATDAENERLMWEYALANPREATSPSAKYGRHRDTREPIEIEPPIGGFVPDEEKRVLRAAVAAGMRKLKRAKTNPYPAGTWLLIWLDDQIPDILTLETRDQLAEELKPVTRAFSRVFAMSFFTSPIVVED